MKHEEIVKLFECVGFTYHESSETTIVNSKDYKYYPSYLKDSHYTILFVKYKKYDKIDYRFYEHRNKDGSFLSTPFQTSEFEKYAYDVFKDIFKQELLRIHRLKMITEILEDGKE